MEGPCAIRVSRPTVLSHNFPPVFGPVTGCGKFFPAQIYRNNAFRIKQWMATFLNINMSFFICLVNTIIMKLSFAGK